MPGSKHYEAAYPRAGDVAILCEGDVIGYEVAMLKKWADAKLRNSPFVDIWACGTAIAIYGQSDAIGRSRPLLAVEDRDFRNREEAARECNASKKDRTARDIVI